MRRDAHIRWPAFQRQRVHAQIPLCLFFQRIAALCPEIAISFIAEHAPGTVIQLQVAAPRRIQRADDRTIRSGNILNQLFIIRIDLLRLLSIILAVKLGQQLCRRRNGLLGNDPFFLKLLHKTEMLHKRMILAADLADHLDGSRRSFFPMEKISMIQFDLLDALKAPHEVQMPVTAAKLAIRDHQTACLLLFLDQRGDLLIFDLFQLFCADRSCFISDPCVLQSRRAQKAAHMIMTERYMQCAHLNASLVMDSIIVIPA